MKSNPNAIRLRRIGRIVRARRRGLDLTQSEVARRVGRSVAAVHRYEAGKVKASTAVLRRLARALKLTLSDIEPTQKENRR